MLGQIDRALAGAIDFVADDITATVKSVKKQGIMRTLGDAVEDAAGIAKEGVGGVLGFGGKSAGPAVSQHSGVSSGYADLCAGRAAPNGMHFQYNGPQATPQVSKPSNTGGYNAGGPAAFAYNGPAAFPYDGGAAKGPSQAAKTAGTFGANIGIRRSSDMANVPGMGGGMPAAPAASPPADYYTGSASKTSAAPAPAAAPGVDYYTGAATTAAAPAAAAAAGFAARPAAAAASAPSVGGGVAPGPALPKGQPLPQDFINNRFDMIRAKDKANNMCFDCGIANPEWASVSFGILVCITCSGHHRQLGTHISRIRSCKMDTWTQQAIGIFDFAGNAKLSTFFAANGVNAGVGSGLAKYNTGAAEWYREAFIKNRALGRDVPAPPPGIKAGPSVGGGASASSTKEAPKAKAAAAPAVDLLDMGGGGDGKPAAKAKAAPAQNADLLGVDSFDVASLARAAAAKPSGANFTQLVDTNVGPAKTASGGGDLLGLSLNGNASATPAPALDPMAGLFSSPAPAAAAPALATTATPFSAATPAPAAAPQNASPTAAAPAGANTLAGGAKLKDPEPKKADDPFAMALEKWGM
eukprot:TRINITY_DN36197_c0_g2_i1.p1 TRINITY_DN36197_c0_g2~~TRINITY_DN36197_c0_g2_i1.p1  ORF type:complete len:582 (-),score=165.52 TRINITY_DN36197_c0_g2_i1:118-1863(-)